MRTASRSRPKFCSCALAFVLGSAATLAPPALVADTVSLRYGWEPGMDILITFEGERGRVTGGKTQRVRARGSLRLTTAARGDGIALSYSDFQMEPIDARRGGASVDIPAGPQAEMQKLVARLGGALPQTLIGPDGFIVGFIGTQETVSESRAAFRALVSQLPGESQAPPEKMEQILDQIMTEEVIQQRMVEEWNRDVGVWIGAELEERQLYQSEASGQVALLGNAELSSIVTFQYQGAVPCDERAAERRCVKLVMSAEVDPQGLGPAIRDFTARLSGQQVPEIRAVKVDETVELITDPRTLMPRTITIDKVTTMTIMEGGRPVESGQTEHKVMRYEYR